MRDFTVIYSSASIEALENMINEFLIVFNSPLTIEDLFYYNVFCKIQTYAHYGAWDEALNQMDVPTVLTNPCSTASDREDFIEKIVNQILIGEIKKPEWMIYVEMEEYISEYCFAPSTFLFLKPKQTKYQKLADKIIDFLYSPNLLITMVK